MQLSEPLLWYIWRVLDNEMSLELFTAMGGVEVLCKNLVKSSGTSVSNVVSLGVVAMVMQHLSNAPNLVTPTLSSTKKSSSSQESCEDGLMKHRIRRTSIAEGRSLQVCRVVPLKRDRNSGFDEWN